MTTNTFKARAAADKPAAAAEGASLADLPAVAAASLTKAIAADVALAALIDRLPDLERMKSDAAQRYTELRRQDADWHAARSASVQVQAAAKSLVNGTTATAARPVTPEQINEGRQHVAITEEAVQIAKERISNQRAALGRKVAEDLVFPTLKVHTSAMANMLACLLADAVALHDSMDALRDAGIPNSSLNQIWNLSALFGDPRNHKGIAAYVLRDAMKDGFATVDGLEAAMGNSPRMSNILAGRDPSDMTAKILAAQQARIAREAAAVAAQRAAPRHRPGTGWRAA